ncbi:MAG: DUF6391 domain-containing protein [Cyanobacteria bacterium J06621_8]
MKDVIFADASFEPPYSHPHQDAELLEQYGFLPGLKEFLLIRQVHALEHATVWMLSNNITPQRRKLSTSYLSVDNETIGGLSTERGFYIYGDFNPLDLKKAVGLALIRLQQGEWNLALHPRCGTNSSVTAILTAGMTLAAHLSLPRSPVPQIFGIGLAAMAAHLLAPDVGIYVQKYVTTAIPFNIKPEKISRVTDKSGNSGYFVKVKWIGNNN